MNTTYYRLGLGLAVASLLFLFLAIGALGLIGEGGRPDRMYLAVFATALLGAIIARLRPRGMALALAATALAQVVIGLIALAVYRDHPGASVVDLVGLNAMYAALFGAAGWLFWRAAGEPAPVR